jgi:hypothetical protein
MKMEVNEYVGSIAGRVWEALCKGPKTPTQLQKVTGMTLKEVSMGVGWLAREGKVRPQDSQGHHQRFELAE